MSTNQKQQELEAEGVAFRRNLSNNTWQAWFAGETIAEDTSRGECIWKAAEFLGVAN